MHEILEGEALILYILIHSTYIHIHNIDATYILYYMNERINVIYNF